MILEQEDGDDRGKPREDREAIQWERAERLNESQCPPCNEVGELQQTQPCDWTSVWRGGGRRKIRLSCTMTSQRRKAKPPPASSCLKTYRPSASSIAIKLEPARRTSSWSHHHLSFSSLFPERKPVQTM